MGDTTQTLRPLFTWRSAVADSDLPAGARLVAFTLSLHMNERGGSAFPTVTTISRESGLSRRAVQGHLKLLTEGGWLICVAQSDGRRGREYASAVPPQNLHPAETSTPPPQISTEPPAESADRTSQELSKNSSGARKRAIAPPEDFVPTESHRSFAQEHGLDLERERERWLTRCEAKGETYKSVNAGFTTWLHQALDFGRGGKKPLLDFDALSRSPTPHLDLPRTCPIGECDGSGWIDVEGENAARRCAHLDRAVTA